jgi:hypothetical protein
MGLHRTAGAGLGLFVGLLLLAGCGEPAKPSVDAEARRGQPSSKGNPSAGEKTALKDKHDDWWCKEHGIPEDECSMCSDKVAKECKAKGDWCEKHDRAKSQCFICDPRRKEFYAAKYRAKYGKEPPPIEDKE